MRSLFDSFPGCKVCEGSDFLDACFGCKLEGCLLTCESCLDRYGNVGQPAPFTVPAVGCYVEESQTQLRCRPFSLGSCDDRQLVRFGKWSPLGFAWVASLLGLLLIAILTCLLMKHRRHKRPPIKAGSSKRPATRVFRPVVPNQTCQTRLSSVIQSSLCALRPAPSPANTNLTLESSSASQSVPELLHNNEHRLPAAMVDLEDIQFCKRAKGEDWLLGSGSFGMVYKGKMGELDVAVKMIQKQHVNPQISPQHALRVMQQELHMLETIPFDDNIVQFYGSYTQHGNILLVLEYMQGGDLRQALQGPLAASLTWYNKGGKLALDVIKGLHFLHCNRILHRDIKSGNILLSQHFESAKICDVGLAHIMTNTSLSSSTSSSGGQQVQTTLAYAAPELLLCLRCDEKADIFSYGVVLWELITQQRPRRGCLRDLQVPEECPQAVSELVNACLEQEAADRPTAQQIIHVIQTHIGQS